MVRVSQQNVKMEQILSRKRCHPRRLAVPVFPEILFSVDLIMQIPNGMQISVSSSENFVTDFSTDIEESEAEEEICHVCRFRQRKK